MICIKLYKNNFSSLHNVIYYVTVLYAINKLVTFYLSSDINFTVEEEAGM